MFRFMILMAMNAILYSVLPQPASAVSSARGILGRLSRNGHLMNTLGTRSREVAYEEIRAIMAQSLDEAGSKHLSSPMRIPLPDGDRSR